MFDMLQFDVGWIWRCLNKVGGKHRSWSVTNRKLTTPSPVAAKDHDFARHPGAQHATLLSNFTRQSEHAPQHSLETVPAIGVQRTQDGVAARRANQGHTTALGTNPGWRGATLTTPNSHLNASPSIGTGIT